VGSKDVFSHAVPACEKHFARLEAGDFARNSQSPKRSEKSYYAKKKST